jgi:hypothetical protein
VSEHITRRDGVEAAMSVAEDLTSGALDPAALVSEVAATCRDLFAEVVGPDDPIWAVQAQVCRGVLAAGGIPADELAEWLAVARHRAGIAAEGNGTAAAANVAQRATQPRESTSADVLDAAEIGCGADNPTVV